MQKPHCDLCGEIVSDNTRRPEITIQSTESRIKLRIDVENIITRKDLGDFGMPSNIEWFQSFREMQREGEGFDICRDCWLKLLEKITGLKWDVVELNIPIMED